MSTTERRTRKAAPVGDDRDGHHSQDLGKEGAPSSTASDRPIDPRAVRVALGPAFSHVPLPPMVVEPPVTPLAPTPSVVGIGILGGTAAIPLEPTAATQAPPGAPTPILIDGEPASAALVHHDEAHATLIVGQWSGDILATPLRLLLEPVEPPLDGRGATRREVVVDGWRIELEIESERRAALRDRARRGREESARGGPTEVHAIIPGRVVSVSVAPGDAIVASQQLLVVEAMKMQNELRAPRDGTISKVAVAPGDLIEIGDLLLVLE